MTIAAGGNVLIGSSSASLHSGSNGLIIVGGGGGRAIMELHDSSASGKAVFQQVGGTTYIGSLAKGSGSGDLILLSNGIGSSANESVYVKANGNILIGTSTDNGARLNVVGSTIRHGQSDQNASLFHNGSLSIGNGSTVTLSVANGSLVFVSENNTGDGALFFCGYKSATITLISDPNNRYAVSDTAGRGCLFKSANTGDVTFKNNLGSTLSFTFYQIKNSD
jgi:hypothetical protein